MKKRPWYVKDFGENVSRIRRKRKLSQEKLADRAGLHRTQISLVERGQRIPRLDTIYQLAEALKVEPADLIPLAGRTRLTPSASRVRLDQK